MRRLFSLLILSNKTIYIPLLVIYNKSRNYLARVAELVDARDLKSLVQKTCGFDSRLAHQIRIKTETVARTGGFFAGSVQRRPAIFLGRKKLRNWSSFMTASFYRIRRFDPKISRHKDFFALRSSPFAILQIETAVSIFCFIDSTQVETPSVVYSICSLSNFFFAKYFCTLVLI